jgi:hypothetical protein
MFGMKQEVMLFAEVFRLEFVFSSNFFNACLNDLPISPSII